MRGEKEKYLSWIFSKRFLCLQIFVLVCLSETSSASNDDEGLDSLNDTGTFNETTTVLNSDSITTRPEYTVTTPVPQYEDAITNETTVATNKMGHEGIRSFDNQNITEAIFSSTVMPNVTINITPPNTILEFFTERFITSKISWMVEIYQPSFQSMEEFIKWQFVVDYLSKFENDIQREVVTNQIKFCPYHSLCDFESIAYPDLYSCCAPCDCNLDNCMENNTCCPSILPEDLFKLPNDEDQDIFGSENIKGTEEIDSICISEHLSHQTGKGFEAIARCPYGFQSNLNDLCTKVYTTEMVILDIVPVSSRTTRQVFRNKYCAQCNNVSSSDMDYFKAIFSCDNYTTVDKLENVQEAISLAYSSDYCDITFIQNDSYVQLKECDYIIDKCNVTGAWKTYDPVMELACSLYSSMTRYANTLFRNAFCALCNGILPRVSCFTDNPVKSDTFPFSGLLSLDSKQAITATHPLSKKDSKSSCSNNQMFDSLFEKCRDLICPKNTYHQSGSCTGVYSAVTSNIIYEVDLRLIPTTTITVEEALEIEFDIVNEIYGRFNDIHKDMGFCYSETALKTNTKYSLGNLISNGKPDLSYIDTRYKLSLFQIAGFQNPPEIVDSILEMRHNVIQVNRSHGEPLGFRIVFTQFDARLINLIELVKNIPHSRRLFLKNASEKLEMFSQYAFSDVDGLMIIPTTPTIFIPPCFGEHEALDVIKHSSCPRVSVSSNEVKWTIEVDGILVDGLKIDRGTFYFIDDQHIMMCLEQYKALARHLIPSRSMSAELIVSVACACLSILSLLVTVITFAIFPKLHKSLPGHNNIALSVSLLIAQIMLLVGSISPFDQYSIECKTIGLLIHFSWLCVIFWMNVNTYHIFRTLTRSELPKQTFDVKKCVLYHLYVLLSSMIFVGLNILTSGLESDGIGYGGKYCYITSQQRILITFVAPTILVVLINLFMFLIVICKVTKKSDVRKNVKHERNDLVIFAKLATLTGISWIFGFLYIWTNISALSYIFTVLNAGQGVFIMVSFVLNRRVFAMFKDLIRKTGSTNKFEGKKQTRWTSSAMM